MTCKRCNGTALRFSGRRSKLYGGLICAKCSKEMGEAIEARRSGNFRTSTVKTEAPQREVFQARRKWAFATKAILVAARLFGRGRRGA